MTEPLTRRDFLKLAGSAAIAIKTGLPSLENPQNLTADIVPASDKFIQFFAEKAKEKGISTEGVGFFGVRRGFETTEFATLPPTETVDSNGQAILADERLFMLEYRFSLHGGKYNTVVELEKGEDNSAGNISIPIVVWRYLRQNPRPHKNADKIVSKDDVLWYPNLSNEQWSIIKDNPQLEILKGVTFEDFYSNMGFAPASNVLSSFLIDTSYNREDGYAFRIDLNKLSDKPHKALLARERVSGKWGVKVEQIDISNPENFRTVEWDYLTSPAYLAELEQKEKAGLLPKIPENVSYVKEGFVNYKPDDDTSSEMIQSYGNGPIFTLSNDIVYLDINKRPFVLVDICKTEIEGVPMIFFTQMWKNSDGSHAFNSHFLPDSKTVRTELDYYINGNYNGKNYGYQAGAFFVKDSKHGDGFDYYMNILTDKGTDSSKLKTYYYENVEMFLSPDIYKSWGETGILKNSNTVLVSPFGLDAIQN